MIDINIKYQNGILTVANNGTVFTKETIERLCHGSASNKSDDFIGCKGTGFRSVLNWGKQIEIHSGGFHIGFSQAFADQVFNELLEESDLVRQQQKNLAYLSMPVLHCPFEVEAIASNYDTVIKIETDESLQRDQQNILSQINSFDYKSLIFLPHITQITIQTETSSWVVEKKIKGSHEIEIHTEKGSESYLFFQNQDEPYLRVGKQDKKIKSAIAISLDPKANYTEERLYCFFPIRSFQTPLNCLMHATFDLNTSRDDVPFNEINRQVFQHLLKFVIEVSEKELTQQPDKLLAFKTLALMNLNSKLWGKYAFGLISFKLD